MASIWPRRPLEADVGITPRNGVGFEREGDKMYLAAEVLQGWYGKENDIFRYVKFTPVHTEVARTLNLFRSFGMTMLETAANIVVPAQ